MNLPKRRKPDKLGCRSEPQIRCQSHLKWIRGHECAAAALAPGSFPCLGRIEAAHVRRGTDGGLSVKPGDNWVIPLCSHHHAEQHRIGEMAFESKYAFNMRLAAQQLWAKSPHKGKVQP